MRSSRFVLLSSAAVAIAAQLWGDVASAQEASKTTATYGAWVMRCSRQKDGTACEIVQSLLAGKRKTLVAQLAIGQLPKTKAPRAVLRVPAGVDLTKPPVLVVDEKSQYQGRYFLCAGRFCRAEIELPAQAKNEIAKAKKVSIRFMLRGKSVELPITTDGMATALEKALQATG